MLSKPQVTIAIPTCNRGAILQQVCEALLHQSVSAETFSLLIIDNNSTDDTPQRMAEMAKQFPHFIYCVEKKAGSSHARNAAWQHCETPWIAYLDDDAKPFPGYVEALLRAIARGGCEVIAGKVVPWRLQPLPSWFCDEYESYAPAADADGYLNAKDFAIGGNMALKCEAIRRAGGFDPRFGVKGTVIPYGEETVLQIGIRKHGGRIRYAADMQVAHLAKSSRYTIKTLLKIAYLSGKSTPIIYNWHGAKEFFRLCLKIPYRLGKVIATSIRCSIQGTYAWQNCVITIAGEVCHLWGMFVGFFWLKRYGKSILSRSS